MESTHPPASRSVERFLRASLLVAVVGLLPTAWNDPGAAETPASRPPNFVIVFVDDVGYADIGPFGSTGYETPNLDRMAREGRRFTDFYVAHPVCSASRAALLTGSYGVRVGIVSSLSPKATHGLNPEETTIADLVRQKGYATACYGKWHLGHQPKFLPTSQGFDEYYGLPYSNDMRPHSHASKSRFPDLPLLEDTTVIDPQVTGEDQDKLTRAYTERAVAFIEKHKDGPFLLYLPHTMAHVPLHVSNEFRGKSKRGLYGDVMQELDWSVGRILDTLREHDLDRNTMVIFTSDNGPWLSYGVRAGSAGPLREGKGTVFEGGCRVPTVFWWPGTIPADTVCKEPAMTIDILPTIAHLTGAKLPERKIDGKNIWPLISGEPGAVSPHEAYFFYYVRELQAVRMGKWKLHFPHDFPTLGGKAGGADGRPANRTRETIELSLFDLENDVSETTNVAAQHPEIVARIGKLAERMRDELGDSLTEREGSGVRPRGQLEEGDPRFDWIPGRPIQREAK